MTLVVVAAVVLGLLVGSFVNVLAHRVPRGESVVRPRSACPSCGHPIRVRDNVPVVSWLLLRGRCRDCGAGVSVRYPAVELLTAAVFGLLAWRLGPDAALPAFLYLGGIGVALAVIDLDVKRLPNALTLPSYVVVPALLGLAAVADGDPGAWVRAMVAGAALYAFYFVLALVYPAGMGFGDVKLAGILGMYLGWLGWDVWVVGAFLGFLLGGLTGVVLMVAHRASRKSEIPFGPFMLAGVLLAVLVGEPVAQAYLDTLA